MRAIFIAFAVFGLCGCDFFPDKDLRNPIYMAVDSSFGTGCEDDWAGYETCLATRVKKVENGVNEWFKHFDEATRPQVVIVYSKEELPPNRINDIIYLKVKKGGCRKDNHNNQACYPWTWNSSSQEIVFDSPARITPNIVAHEFGHALGRGHDDTPVDIYSIMSYELPSSYVVPVDINLVCDMHAECPPHENTWCKGSFYDPCRCPSASYEEGEAKRKTGEISCE